MGRTYGYIQSKLTGNEKVYSAPENVKLFDTYDLRPSLDPIRDQGDVSKCVSCALTDMVRYKMSIGVYEDSQFDDAIFYDTRPDPTTEGMQPIDAFNYLVNTGVNGQKGEMFAMVKSAEMAKRAIVANGPVMACLLAKSYETDFWNGWFILGGHATLLVGYNNDGFILRNSWGKSYGKDGYSIFPYKKFNTGLEYWTLIS